MSPSASRITSLQAQTRFYMQPYQMPSRIAAIARGTGEVDPAYHISFDALREVVREAGSAQQKNDPAELIGQGRLRPYEELATTLSTW
jgi:hypothetical protein